MSQRECAAFNWPQAGTISHPDRPSKYPIGVSPKAVNRASFTNPFRGSSAGCPRFSASFARGVPQPLNIASSFNGRAFRSIVSWLASPLFQSLAAGVPHALSIAAPSKSIPPVCVSVLLEFGPPLGVFGVGHGAKVDATLAGTHPSGPMFGVPVPTSTRGFIPFKQSFGHPI
jgi:hypothetical protein